MVDIEEGGVKCRMEGGGSPGNFDSREGDLLQ
jgi:hypothetical protein